MTALTHAKRSLRAAGGSATVLDLAALPAAEPPSSDREITFRAGAFVSRCLRRLPPHSTCAIRPTSPPSAARVAANVLFLARRRRCVAALALLAAGELACSPSRLLAKTRLAQLNAQKTHRRKIIAAQNSPNRVDELATKRLLPFEMIFAINQKAPAAIQFQRVRTDGLNKLVVEAITGNAAEISLFKTALEAIAGRT